MDLETRIRGYLAENILYHEDGIEYSNDASFVTEALIDSMGIMELVNFVESEFSITVSQDDVTPDNFDSVSKLASYIRTRLGASVAAG